LREYLGLTVPFYLHAGVYTRPDTRKFAAVTALLHRSGGFLNVVVQVTMADVEYTQHSSLGSRRDWTKLAPSFAARHTARSHKFVW